MRRSSKRKDSKSSRGRSRRGRKRPTYNPQSEPRNMKSVKFNRYINTLRRKLLPQTGIHRESMTIIDKMMKNVMHGIATEASQKMGRRKVLNPKILHRALRGVMPKNMRERVDEIGRQAVDRYLSHGRQRRRRRRR